MILVKRVTLLLIGLFLYCSLLSFAQEESPLPGVSASQSDIGAQQSRQVTDYPGSVSSNSAPLPGQAELNNQVVSKESGKGKDNKEKDDLPVSIDGLKALVEDMKSKSSDNEQGDELVNKYLVWVDGLIKAHNKLAGAFAKQADFQAAGETERDMSRRLYQIKDQFLFLKAKALIKNNQWAEALPILVDITVVEPKSSVGQAAYLCLKQAGFSPDAKRIVSADTASPKKITEKSSNKLVPSKASMHKYLPGHLPADKQ